MANMINFADMKLTTKNSMTVKAKAKETLEQFLIKALKEYYGEENVSEVFKDGNNMKGKALSVGMGVVQDEGGFDIEVCVNVELTAKSITETSRKTSTGISVTPIYDRLSEAENYANEMEHKQKEKEEKKEKAETKKKKDKLAREKAKETKTKIKTDSVTINSTSLEQEKQENIPTVDIKEQEKDTNKDK